MSWDKPKPFLRELYVTEYISKFGFSKKNRLLMKWPHVRASASNVYKSHMSEIKSTSHNGTNICHCLMLQCGLIHTNGSAGVDEINNQSLCLVRPNIANTPQSECFH